MSSRALLPSVLALTLAAAACSGLGKMDVLPGAADPVDPAAPNDDGGPPPADGAPVEPGDVDAGVGGDDAGDVDAGVGGDDAAITDAGVPDDGGPYQDGTPTCRTAAGDVQCGGSAAYCCLTYNEAPVCRNGAIMAGPGCQVYRIYCDSADDCPGRRPCCGRRMSDSRIAFTCSLSADSCPNGYGGQPPWGQMCNPANVDECLGGRTCGPVTTGPATGYHRCL